MPTIIWLLIGSILSMSIAFADESVNPVEPGPKTFIVTAYYSPLPDQSFYLRGSYEADIKLNGGGVKGASGKPVYSGMLAGPKAYPFGTAIKLNGIGIGKVDDRGGAIVKAGERGYNYDRIDIWVGAGETGLKRALTWGKRTIQGEILDTQETLSTIQIETFKIGNIISPSGLESIFSFAINADSSPNTIKNLQDILTKLEYYKGENNGKWDREITNALCEFQKEKQIVKTCNEFAAGYFGPKTRSVLKTAWNEYQTMIQANNLAKVEAQKKKEKIADQEREQMIAKGVAYAKTLKKAETTVQSFGSPTIGEVGPHIRKLQLALKDLGFYKEKDTAIFWEKTRKALLSYQRDRGIMASAKSEAGTIGRNTKTKLIEDLLVLGDMNY